MAGKTDLNDSLFSLNQSGRADTIAQSQIQTSSSMIAGGNKIEDFMIEKQLPKRAKSQKVRAYIYQCKDLPAADDDGLSDPFI